jgi:hypothetical protein
MTASADTPAERARVLAILAAHTPSITDRAEEADPDRYEATKLDRYGFGEYIGMYRECRCRVIIEGYYEFVDHLRELIEAKDEAGKAAKS